MYDNNMKNIAINEVNKFALNLLIFYYFKILYSI